MHCRDSRRYDGRTDIYACGVPVCGMSARHMITSTKGINSQVIIQSPMTQGQLWRVEISHECFLVIEAESYMQDKSMKEVATAFLMSAASEEAKRLAQQKIKKAVGKPPDQVIKASSRQVTKASSDQPTTKPKAATKVIGRTQLRSAIEFAVQQFNEGKKVTVPDVAEYIGLYAINERKTLGTALGKYGIKSTSGAPRYYKDEMKPQFVAALTKMDEEDSAPKQ